MLNARTIHAILAQQAKLGQPISYAELLRAAGLEFSRPKVRTLCRLLGEIDQEGAEIGEPSLAVLVVRTADKLPGAGWWESRTRYDGPRTGPQAVQYVQQLQRKTFRYWQNHRQNGNEPPPKRLP